MNDNEYTKYVKEITPTHNIITNIIRAFIVGGIICVIGQLIVDLFILLGLSEENSALVEIIVLVFLAALSTGLGWYRQLAKYGGAGALVPITGFANSVAAAAIEYKKEGQVFGIGSFIFKIAGPVILYGIMASFILGIIYWCLTLLNIV